MKKIFSLACLLVSLSLPAVAQQKQAAQPKQSTITVTVDSSAVNEHFPINAVSLFKTVEGTAQLVTAANVSNGQTVFSVDSPKGFYQLTYPKTTSCNVPIYLYLKPGTAVQLSISKDGWVVGANNSKENKKMGELNGLLANIIIKTLPMSGSFSIFTDYFPEADATQLKLDEFLKTAKTGNQEFDAQFPKMAKNTLNYYRLYFLSTPRSKHPVTTDLSKFYSDMAAKPINDESILSLPIGVSYMGFLIQNKARMNSVKVDDMQAWAIQQPATKRLKGALVLGDFMRYVRTYEQYDKINKQYGSYLANEAQRSMAKAIGDKQPKDTKVGTDGFNFSYPDIDGKTVSFSDLKGKLVLVDIWATWCGPCRKQLPYLMALEKELHDKDICFVAIGTDVEKDKAKWEAMVKDQGMEGIQLFGGDRSKEIKGAYGIEGIPRFMLFDKNGKVITSEAPLPSDPKLKELILKHL